MIMQVDVSLILDAYREEINGLMNENILLKAQLKQLQNELASEQSEAESQQ